MGNVAKLSRLCKVLPWKAARALAQGRRQSSSSALLLLILPSNWSDCSSWEKGERGAVHSSVAASGVCTINYSWHGAAFPILPALSVPEAAALHRLFSEQTPLLLCLGLGPSCRKTWRNSFSSDRTSLGIAREHKFLSVWHTCPVWKPLATMLKTLIVPMPQSLKRGRETGKTGKEAKEKKNSELNIYKYSYEILFFFIFSSWENRRQR